MPLLAGSDYYSLKLLDVIPAAITTITPIYPKLAISGDIEGAVTLALLIDENGVVNDATVVKAQPQGYFEKSTLDAFRNARFIPAQLQGRAVKSKVTLTVRFELNDTKNR